MNVIKKPVKEDTESYSDYQVKVSLWRRKVALKSARTRMRLQEDRNSISLRAYFGGDLSQ